VLIAGLWPQREAVADDLELQKALGADRCVISLSEAIEATLNGLHDRSASDHPAAVLAPSA
jgi:hypothetical protein